MKKIKGHSFEKDEDGTVSVSVAKKRFVFVPYLICLFLALLIWIYITNVSDSDVPSQYNVHITVSGEESLVQNKRLSVSDMALKDAVVYVKGTNRELRQYTADDFSLSLDVSNMTSSGDMQLKCYLPSGSKLEVVKIEPELVYVTVEENVEKNIPIEYSVGVITIDKSYTYEMVPSSETLAVSGPKSYVENIQKIRCSLNPGKVESSLTVNSPSVTFYDNGGNQIIALNYLKFDASDLSVALNVYAESEVPVVVLSNGEALDGSRVTVEPSTLVVSGDPVKLRQFTKYTVDVAGNNQTISRITSEELLQEFGVKLAGKEELQLDITVTEPEEETKNGIK